MLCAPKVVCHVLASLLECAGNDWIVEAYRDQTIILVNQLYLTGDSSVLKMGHVCVIFTF